MIRIKDEAPAKRKRPTLPAPPLPPARVKINWLPYATIVTKSPRRRVTKAAKKAAKNKPRKGGDLPQGQEKAPVPPPAGVGRPKVHATAAARQAAYRARLKEAKA